MAGFPVAAAVVPWRSVSGGVFLAAAFFVAAFPVRGRFPFQAERRAAVAVGPDRGMAGAENIRPRRGSLRQGRSVFPGCGFSGPGQRSMRLPDSPLILNVPAPGSDTLCALSSRLITR